MVYLCKFLLKQYAEILHCLRKVEVFSNLLLMNIKQINFFNCEKCTFLLNFLSWDQIRIATKYVRKMQQKRFYPYLCWKPLRQTVNRITRLNDQIHLHLHMASLISNCKRAPRWCTFLWGSTLLSYNFLNISWKFYGHFQTSVFVKHC